MTADACECAGADPPSWAPVVIRHAVKNALIPVVSLIGLQLPILVGGAVVSGINLFFATGVVGINLMIDLIYAVLDPRVRYD